MATRKILAMIVALALVLGGIVCLSGCSKERDFELAESKIGGLVAISRQENFIEGFSFDQIVFYDSDTLVMYSMVYYGEGIGITVLYNADGTPKLYNPDK